MRISIINNTRESYTPQGIGVEGSGGTRHVPRLPPGMFKGEHERESLEEKMQPGWEPKEE